MTHQGWTTMNQTEQNANDQRYFDSGWNAALTEVLATARHQGDEAAVWWANQHLIDTAMRDAR